MQKKNKLSIILLSYYSENRLVSVYNNISKILDANNIDFELIIMDDGSKDKSFELALELEKLDSRVSAHQLSRNFTGHYSVFAGLSICTGDCAMPMVDDEQQPYQTIVDMYNLWLEGEKIIIPYRISRNDGWLKNSVSNLYYNIMNYFSDITYPKGGADIFLIDREIIDIMNDRIHPINTSSVVEVMRLGFDPYYYGYDRVIGTNNKTRWTLKKKIRLAKDTFFSSSAYPIKFIFNLGLLVSLISFILIAFYTYIKLFGNPSFWGIDQKGWTSIILFISFFSGLIIFSLGIIAEYIWRIYEEVKNRPGFIIKKKPQ